MVNDTPYAMTVTAAKREELITQFRDTFKFASEADKPQRDRETEDLQFQVPELQWDPEAAASRKGTKDGGTVVLPRPMLSISKLDQPIRLAMSQARQAHLGINIHPVSEQATDDTAEVLQDLIRRIERDSNAPVARLWALDRAIKCGRGVYRVDVQPDEDGFQYGDLEIVVKRVLYQSCVFFDPSAQEPDFSDGDFAYVTSWMLLSKAARLYKGTRAASVAGSSSGLEWAGMKQDAPEWVNDSGAGKSIQIAECFWKVHEEKEALILDDGRVVLDGKVPNRRKVIARRVKDDVQVWKALSDGFDLLEEPKRWFGKYIPLVPVLGRELQPFDDQRRIIGMIRNARDAQRFSNTSISTLVERMFMEPRAPWVMVEGQDENRANEWAKSNYLNIPVLHYKMVMDASGQVPAPPPFRTPIDQTGMSIALLAVQEAGSLCQEATAFFDPSLGKNAAQHESGRKVLALQGQGDEANSDWLEGLAIALNYEARIHLDLIAPTSDLPGIYDAPGRITTVLGGDNAKPRKVMLNRPYVMDPRTSLPRAARKGEDGAKHYDLKSGARYGVSIDIGQSFKSRLQEGDETLTRIIEAAPTLLTVVGDILFQFKDTPGAKDIAERLNLLIRGMHPEMFKDEQSGQQDMEAKAQAMEQQLQTVTQQLQQASQALATDKAKQDANVAIAQLHETAAMKIAEMNNAAKIEVARITAAKEAANHAAEAQEELLATTIKVSAEADATAVAQSHERRLQHESQAHDVAMAAAGGMQRSGTTEKGQEHGQEHTKESTDSGSNTPAGGAGA